ncbi:MAG: hypothetical protein WC928_02950 [Patescibacteria group bacterium]|jgi:hypothetical protein
MKKNGLNISAEFLYLVVGFILGFLVAFTFSWNTIVYIINTVLEK